MYVSELKLSTKVTNALLRANVNTVGKLSSIINDGALHNIHALDNNGIKEVMSTVYCRDCKRSIYGDYADCDIDIENKGRYVRGVSRCCCKVTK